ncbi:MAG TPA: hypothetical protein VFS21_16220 [Roseiflexaceae bacterium]|nr:hypothetical protein [Roseiflexaceae bacterium]
MDYTPAPAQERDTLLQVLTDMIFAGARSGTLSESLAWYFLRRLAALMPVIADAFVLGGLAQCRVVADQAPARVPPALSMVLADGIYTLTRQPTPEAETAVCWRVLAQLAVLYPAIGAMLTPEGQATVLAHALVQPVVVIEGTS